MNCYWIVWPGWRTTVSAAWSNPPDPGKSDWWGGLVDGMRDASGRKYMRNRYYDPATGQFTQTDPIGVAGGLNTYGFAAGDPVSYSDPYGLAPCFIWPIARTCTWADIKENVGTLFSRYRDEPEQITAGLSLAPHLFSMAATGTLAAPANVMTRTATWRIADRDGQVMELVGTSAQTEVTVMAIVTKEGEQLVLRGVYIDGAGPGSAGQTHLRAMFQDLGRQSGVKEVVIEGARRSTGRHAGRVPRPMTIKVDE